jgi:hypothetical protein
VALACFLDRQRKHVWADGHGQRVTLKAEMQRLLELRVDEMPRADVDLQDVSAALFKDVQANYGHFGAMYVQYVINNRERYSRAIQADKD